MRRESSLSLFFLIVRSTILSFLLLCVIRKINREHCAPCISFFAHNHAVADVDAVAANLRVDEKKKSTSDEISSFFIWRLFRITVALQRNQEKILLTHKS